MKRINWVVLIGVIIGSFLSVVPFANAAPKPIYEPDPIPIPRAVSTDNARSIVRTALLGRGWIVTNEGPGHMEARLNIRDHVAIVTIRLDDNVTIRYKSSENLDYSATNAEIHGNYNNWIQNIEKDITVALKKTALDMAAPTTPPARTGVKPVNSNDQTAAPASKVFTSQELKAEFGSGNRIKGTVSRSPVTMDFSPDGSFTGHLVKGIGHPFAGTWKISSAKICLKDTTPSPYFPDVTGCYSLEQIDQDNFRMQGNDLSISYKHRGG